MCFFEKFKTYNLYTFLFLAYDLWQTVIKTYDMNMYLPDNVCDNSETN